MKYIVHLRASHIASGLSKYRVCKDTGMSMNTISKYVDEDNVEAGQLATTVAKLARYYGVDWRDPAIVELVFEEGEEFPENKTPLALPA